MGPAFRMARSQSLRSAVNEISIVMYLVSVTSVVSITMIRVPEAAVDVPGQTVS